MHACLCVVNDDEQQPYSTNNASVNDVANLLLFALKVSKSMGSTTPAIAVVPNTHQNHQTQTTISMARSVRGRQHTQPP